MIIIDQNFNEVTVWHTLNWGGSGSFMPVSKINQVSMTLRQVNLKNFHKVMIVTATNVDFGRINASDVDLVIVNFSDHPFDYCDYRNLTKPCLVLHWDFRSANHHPYHLIYSAAVAKTDSVEFELPRPYSVSVVNGKPRIHRIYMMLKLHEQQFFDQIQKTWRHISEYNYIPDWDLVDIKFSDLSDAEWQQFYTIQTQLPDTPVLTEELSCAMIGPGFTDSYLNLITEASCEDNGFLSEKIYKPIRAGQLFLLQGPPGAVSAVRDMGFDVYDDYFDHESYDHVSNWRERTDAVITELVRVYDQIPDIWHATAQRRMHNANLLRSPEMFSRSVTAFGEDLIINI